MPLKKIISTYTTYNHWANQNLIQWLQTLEEKTLYQETPSSFNSIDLTLRHMADSQRFWLAIITETNVAKGEDSTTPNTRDSVFNSLLTGSQQIIDICEAYTGEDLLKQVPSTDMVQTRYEYILHVINHNTYHRGQIITMSHCLRVSGNIPPLDYEVFLWSKHPDSL